MIPVSVARLVPTLLLLATPALAGVPGISPRIDDQVMVQLRPEVTLASFLDAWNADHPTAPMSALDQVPGRPIHLLEVDLPADVTEFFIDTLEFDLETQYPLYIDEWNEPGIDGEPEPLAEFLYENEAPEGHTGATYVDGLAPSAFENQFARNQLGVNAAHARSTGVGTVVALLDTGLDLDHPAFAGRIVPGGWNFVDGNGDVSETADGTDNDGDGATDEMFGHGTFTAGIVQFVAPDAKLLPIRVLNDDGVGATWPLIRGMYHAIDHGVEVINLSLGTTYRSAHVEVVIAEAMSLGIPVVAAAGNLDRSEPRECPAMCDAFGVSALDPDGFKADFSNYSRRLFISAPGAGDGGSAKIVGPIPGGTYGEWNGTSFAVPFVTGTVALLRSQLRLEPANTNTYLQLQSLLATSATDVYAQNPQFAEDMELGWGRVSAQHATALRPPGPALLGDINADQVVDFTDLTLLLSEWSAAYSPADLDGNNVVDFADLLALLNQWS